MAFDPTLPANNSPVSSMELRRQFNSLKEEVDLRMTEVDIAAATSGSTEGINALNLTISNPPTQAQVQAIANKIDQMLTALKRE